MKENIYITSSIPYVNSAPHIGFALELVLADAAAGCQRLLGNTVFFQTGADENAFKNVLSAKEKGVPAKEFVDCNSALFRELCVKLNICFDNFIKTSEPPHKRGVENFWRSLRHEDIFTGSYQGLYCRGCEDFCLEGNLINGLCPEHLTKPEPVSEENFFFRLSAYQDKLYRLIESDTIEIIPRKLKNEILCFIRGGLKDISISRAEEKSGGWGIHVPENPGQIIYVWIDALINYISGLGYGDDSPANIKFWSSSARKTHIIGKSVWKFHAVYWPALLISAGLPLPDRIVIHGFLTVNGQKISKSLGNAVSPFPLIERFGADALRYYLLRHFSPFGDGDFREEEFLEIYNSDLANGIGNLVSRLLKLRILLGGASFQEPEEFSPPEEYLDALNNFEFNNALRTLWSEITEINRDIDRSKPWLDIKNNDKIRARENLKHWLGKLYRIAYYLKPFLPGASQRIQDLLRGNTHQATPPLFPRAEIVRT